MTEPRVEAGDRALETARKFTEEVFTEHNPTLVANWTARLTALIQSAMNAQERELREALAQLTNVAGKYGIMTNHVEAAQVEVSKALSDARKVRAGRAREAGRESHRDKPREMTLLDGTVVRESDKVRAIGGGSSSLRVCKVLEILKGCGVDKALVTAPDPFGTHIRTRYQIKARRPK